MLFKSLFSVSLLASIGTLALLTPVSAVNETSLQINEDKKINPLARILPEQSIAQTLQKKPEIPTKPRQYTGIVGKVDKIAQQITVRIDSNLIDGQKSNGSGVIIARQGNSYYVATAKHVLCTNLDTPECEANGQHQIVTPDGITHKLDYQTVEANQTWLDVAIFSFKSSNNYTVATLSKDNPGDQWIFVSGFPGVKSRNNTQPSWLITMGRARTQEQKDFVVKDAYSLKSNGQGLVYTNISYRGMSGGAVLDSSGRLVGINTGAEVDYTTDEGLNLGYSLGISIQDFLELVEKGKMKLKLQWLKVETTQINDGANIVDIVTIGWQQLINTTKPNVDAGIAAWMNYGNQFWRYGTYGEALNAFEKVIELEPNFDQAYYAIGLALLSQRNYEQAVVAFLKATDINPSPYYYWRYLGLSYVRLENYHEAKVAYNRAIDENTTKDFVLYIEQGNLLNQSKDYQNAIESYTEAIKINKDHPWAYNNRGFAYGHLKQYDKAITDYTQAIKINPQSAGTYNNRGIVYGLLKQYNNAISDFNQAIEIRSNYAEAYNHRGIAYKELKQYNKAITDCNQAIEIKPNYTEAYYNRGVVYHLQRKWEQALADYHQSLSLEQHYLPAIVNIGLIDYEMGEIEIAKKQFEKALSVNNESAEVKLALAITLFTQGEIESGLLLAENALKLDKNFADVDFLKENLWGEKIIADTQKLFAMPKIQALLAN